MLQQPPAEIQILHEVVILYFAILVSEEKNGVLVKFWSLGVVIHGKCIETRLAGGWLVAQKKKGLHSLLMSSVHISIVSGYSKYLDRVWNNSWKILRGKLSYDVV